MVVSETMRHSSLRPVHTLKHIIDIQGGLVIATGSVNDLVVAVAAPDVQATANVVEEGSTVNAIFLNIQVAASSTAALANVYMYVVKNGGNQLALVNANAVGLSAIRKYVIHQEMIMTEKNTTAIPRTLFKGVIRIPRGYKRFGLDDKLQVVLFSPGVTMDFCIQCIYKEVQ